MSDRRTAVDILERFAFALELLEGASQAARAYGNAARTVRMLEGELREMRERGELEKVRGLGKSAMRAIDAALEGKVPEELVALEAQIPEGLFEVRRVRGLGPAKIRALREGLGITSLGELEQACQENRLVTLKGFGDKTQAKVLEGIAAIRATAGRYHRHRAAQAAAQVIAHLEARGARALVVGELRRGHELVTDLGVLVEGEAVALDEVPRAEVPVRLEAAPRERFGVRALALTAAPEHFRGLVARAAERGLALDAERLRDASGALVPCPDEASVYDALDLATTPAERRDAGVPLALKGKAVPRLVRREDLRGALHNHTVASDGSATLAQMRDAAEARGLSYLGISEHSQSAEYARGLSEERLVAQIEEIERMRRAGGCTLLTGIESDILPDGALDYEGALLARLEVVVASVHRRHGLDREATTARMLGAVRNPATDIVGHPTGRLLLGRAPNNFDVEAFLDAAAERGCAVELNASPHRLDLSAEHLAMAKARGVLISIAADAHAVGELDWLDHGVAVARRAGLTPEDVLNTRTLEELRGWLAARRARV